MCVHGNDNGYDHGDNSGGNGYITESLSWIRTKRSIYKYISIKTKLIINAYKWAYSPIFFYMHCFTTCHRFI